MSKGNTASHFEKQQAESYDLRWEKLATTDLSEAPRGRQEELMPVWQRMMRFAGATAEQIEGMLEVYQDDLSMLPEEAMEALLRDAGFARSTLFSQTLLIRSWFARVI